MCASVLALVSNLPAVHAQTTDTWSLGTSGVWNVAGNWSADAVPNNDVPSGATYNVGITDGTSTVTLNTSATINDLTIGSGNTLAINNGQFLAVVGPTIANSGSILINGGAGNNGSLLLNGNVTLSGGGTLTLAGLSGGGGAYIQQQANGVTLTNQSTIQGAGTIGNSGLTLNNSGTINANTAAGVAGILLNGDGGITNTGLLEATGGGTLTLATSVVNTGANITASGAGSVVSLDSVTITGGTLTAKNAGVLETTGTTTLTGVTIATGTTYPVADNTTTVLNGPITDHGTIQITGGAGNSASLILGSNVTLGGPVNMSTATGGGSAYIQGTSYTLTNQSTIQGAGTIGNGLILVNYGTVNANTAGGVGGILLNGGGNGGSITNTGLLEATNGGTLAVDGLTVTNTGGNITASGAGSVVSLDSATITGGTLTAKSAGVLETTGSNILSGVTIAAGTTYPVADNTTTVLNGPITNHGTIQITGGAGADAVLQLGSNVTLSGPVNMSTATGGGNAIIQRSGGGETLTNAGTIQGAGLIGNNGLTMVNSGTIDANTAAGVAGIMLSGLGGFTNTGLLEATNGGTLTVAANVLNTGANITASGTGSVVSFDGASITGGTLTATNSGSLATTGSNTLTGVTIASGTTYPVANGTTTILNGPITNRGTIQVTGGAGSYAVLEPVSNVSLGGTVTLSTTIGGGYALIEQVTDGGVTLTNAGTIQGAGVIGSDGLTLVNGTAGIIDANSTGSNQSTQLLLNGGGITNTGLLEATGGDQLVIQSTSVTNTHGNITASGAGSMVSLLNSSVTGGTLNTSGGGTIESAGTTDLTGVTLSTGSTYTASNNTTTNVLGTITNDGLIQVKGGAGTNGFFDPNGNTTLTGGGAVTLSTATGGGSAYIEQSGGYYTLTNTNNTIQGNGIIGNGGLTVVNSAGGTIDANVSGGTLLINGGGGLTNQGTLAVSSGDLLHVTNGPFTNFSGATLTGGTYNVAGTLEIDELGSAGGEIVTNAANIILNGAGASFIDSGSNNALANLATNAAGGSFGVLGGRNFTTAGNFTNNGTLGVGAGSTFAVTGSLTNFAGTTLTGGTYDVTGTLKFHGANVVTNAANIALTGTAAKITNSTNNGNGLANFATNAATGGFGVLGGFNFTTAGSFTNDGVLTVGSGSTFAVAPASSLTNFSGSTLTGGTYVVAGTLQFAGANIVTNAANITLSGPTAEIENSSSSGNGLANLAVNAGGSSFTLLDNANITTVGNFHNIGILSVGAGSTFDVGGQLTNFSATNLTLTGGTYSVTGTLEFPGANIVTNAAKIMLGGPAALIENSTTSGNGLANLASNASTGKFSLAGNANFTTIGNFSTAGTVSIAAGSTFTVGGPGSYTQTAGTTTDGGTLTAAGGVALSGGALFGGGTITGNLNSTGIVTPGVSATKTGLLTNVGTYIQNAGGSLDIGIAGTIAGTKFDALNSNTAILGGTLNLSQLNGFVPTVGTTFKIVNFNSETGTFATVNGLSINSSEAYTVTYQPTDVLLTVVSTGVRASTAAASRLSGAESRSSETEIPAARDDNLMAENLIRSEDDGALRMTAALRDFNAAYAVGGRQAVAVANEAVLSRQRIAERIGTLNRIKQGRH